MNNSLFAFDSTLDQDLTVPVEVLAEREVELIKIISALEEIEGSQAWRTLNMLVFQKVKSNLEVRLFQESKKSEINSSHLYRLQGQLIWAERYADLFKLIKLYKQELMGLRNNNHAT